MSNEPVIPPPGHGPAPGSGPASGPGATPPPATAAGAAAPPAPDRPASPPWGGPGGGGPEQDGGPLATVQSLVDERPEILVGAAFLGGALAALILKRFGR